MSVIANNLPAVLAGYFALHATTLPGNAISSEGKTVRSDAVRVLASMERSIACFGPKALAISQIWKLVNESRENHGDEADPISDRAAELASELIRALPADVPLPEFAWDPDGSISLDWIQSRHRLFSLGIGERRRFPYAWLDGAHRGHAVAFFDGGSVPVSILEGIRRIMA